ncbi:hypothetical protein PoB_002053000 [Plakobranchus ocellatus]|uniref:Uncharacterized protein n=1 Tax=Plakobranchus ocellatus TaxID=259542 RepID=A0AAV3ZEJ6_9GAST|nr:hypothetical protein PoB_002053000 [Plakobranchus ocellatus]
MTRVHDFSKKGKKMCEILRISCFTAIDISSRAEVVASNLRGRQREKIMGGLATWLGTGEVSDTLAAVKDRDLWRDMIANAYKQGT